MKKFLVQTMIRKGRGVTFNEAEVMAETSREAAEKRKKRAPQQKIIGIREPGSGVDLYEKSKQIMSSKKTNNQKTEVV